MHNLCPTKGANKLHDEEVESNHENYKSVNLQASLRFLKLMGKKKGNFGEFIMTLDEGSSIEDQTGSQCQHCRAPPLYTDTHKDRGST